MQNETITLIFADDHEVVREGFQNLVAKFPGVTLMATAANGEELLQQVRTHQPDVVITDIRMPVMDGIKVAAIIKREFPAIRVIAFTAYNEHALIKDMMEAGATGFAIKTVGSEELLTGIKEVKEGRQFFCNVTAAKMLDLDAPPKSPVEFTDRETEVMKCISAGCTNLEISQILGINVRTVETHRASIYKKIGVKTPVAVALFAMKYGFV